MEAWEKALHKFLVNWKDKKEVMSALVCGSYVTGKPSKHSDIDIHIILSDKSKWRERGNKIVDGFLIEYFINPGKSIKKYFKEDYKENSRCSPTQFTTGKIIFDKNGSLKKIKQEAKIWLNKKFEKKSDVTKESNKYSLWDMLDNLQEVYEKKSKDFSYTYHNFLSKLLNIYSGFLRTSSLQHHHKTHLFLTDIETRKKYLAKEFPDKNFARLFSSAIITTNRKKMMNKYQKLTDHILKKMGGFEINGWKIRSPIKN